LLPHMSPMMCILCHLCCL